MNSPVRLKINCAEKEALGFGIAELSAEAGFEISENGFEFVAVRQPFPVLSVSFDGKRGEIRYCEKCHFFRALGLAVEHLRKGTGEFEITESPHFRMNGIMFDMSQGNAAFNTRTVRQIVRKLALMGLNTLMLYLEDNYEVDGEPYFGYMRPTYKQNELSELDEYAFRLGIEMIPCIQTLAHLPDALRWDVYSDITDYPECLLVGEEKTYEFIEKLIVSAMKPFRTRKIHIGMDEAFRLGTGRYLQKNGFREKGEIISEHLRRLSAILKKHGAEPMMWDDMFFHTFGNRSYHSQDTDTIPESTLNMVPEGMRCVFWEYGTADNLENCFRLQKQLSDRLVFAGGCWAWLGYGMSFSHTLDTSVRSLEMCRKFGINEVFVTAWGDNGAEIPQTVNLVGAQIFAECGYSDVFDKKRFAERLGFCTGGKADDLALLEQMDIIPCLAGDPHGFMANCSKQLMWQDVLTGLVDRNFDGMNTDAHYAALSGLLRKAAGRNGTFDRLFELEASAAEVLSVKSEAGRNIRRAYLENDTRELERYRSAVLPDLLDKVRSLHEIHRKVWFEIYKPFGWDIIDMRYGGLEARIASAAVQLGSYLDGKTENIEELENERLFFNGEAGTLYWCNRYGKIVSPSRIDPIA
ncbi:MAG: beta-N-acetylhexosaminidase [Clostridia bacterium]|nr:beta-N-acetylhexosaminidase [Clostridia bacterium]